MISTHTFASWLDGLADATARSRIAKRLARVELGLMGDSHSVGGGVSELRVDYGPGYRVYFTRRGRAVVVLLCGGDKGSQARDIKQAQAMAADLRGPPRNGKDDPMPLETMPFDVARHLTDPADQAELVAEAFATGDAAVIRRALGIVARARGMSRVAADAGMTREGLYKALSEDGDPKLSTMLGVLSALGLKLSTAAVEAS